MNQPPRPLRILAIVIALGFLFFGLVRLGIGFAMLGAESGWWAPVGEMVEALGETRTFLAENAAQAIFAWSVPFYFGLIAVMGAVLAAGALLYLAGRRGAGLVLIAIYLALHGSMFFNYQLVNPKIWLLAGTVAMWAVLWWRHRAER